MVRIPASFVLRPLFLGFIIACIVGLAFLPGLAGEFVNWDDITHVLENPSVISLDISAIFHETVQKIYIPLTTLSFAVEHKLFGFDPFVYHLNNLLLHILNTLLVYILAQRLGLSAVASFGAALIFGVHPMKVESVAWVTERKDLLYAFFYLIAMNFYIGYLKKNDWRAYAGCFLCGVLSLLAKPMALSLPLILFLLDWLFRRRFDVRTAIEKVPVVAVFVPITWMTYALHIRNPVKDPVEALLMWAWSFGFYIWKFLWPDVLVPVYPVIKPIHLSNPEYGLSLAFLILICASIVLFSKHRWWIFSVWFYFFSIFFLLRFDPANDIHVVADRFMYLPCLGFCFLAGMGAECVITYFKSRKIYWRFTAQGLLWLIVVFLALKSMEQTQIWNNSITLWTHVIKYNPTAFLAYNDRAVAYIGQGHNDLALADYSAILQFDPSNVDAYFNRGLLFKKIGRYASAIDDFTQVIKRYPYYEKAYFHRAKAYQAIDQDAKALADYNRSVQVSPAFADGYMERGNLYNFRGDLDRALADYQKVLELEPANVRAVNNLGTIYAKLSDNDHALSEFNRAVAIDPKHPESYYNRSVIYRRQSQFKKALEDALRSRDLGADVEPEYINELQNLAR